MGKGQRGCTSDDSAAFRVADVMVWAVNSSRPSCCTQSGSRTRRSSTWSRRVVRDARMPMALSPLVLRVVVVVALHAAGGVLAAGVLAGMLLDGAG